MRTNSASCVKVAKARSSIELNCGAAVLLNLKLRRPGIEFSAGQCRMKQSGRLGVERNFDLSQSFVSIEVGTYVLKRHRFLGIGEFNSDELLGLAQHFFRHAQRRRRWRGEGVAMRELARE